MTLSWRTYADKLIASKYTELMERGDITPAEAIKIINRDCYPFGPRSHFPYQAWREAIKAQKIRVGLEQPKNYKDSPKYIPLLEELPE